VFFPPFLQGPQQASQTVVAFPSMPMYKISMEEARWGGFFPGIACNSAQDSWHLLVFWNCLEFGENRAKRTKIALLLCSKKRSEVADKLINHQD
jgi:hypothetical protein